jgi:hypothetical protein
MGVRVQPGQRHRRVRGMHSDAGIRAAKERVVAGFAPPGRRGPPPEGACYSAKAVLWLAAPMSTPRRSTTSDDGNADIEESRDRFDLRAHQIDTIGSATEVAGWPARGKTNCVAGARGAGTLGRNHPPMPEWHSAIACVTPLYAPQRQRFSLIRWHCSSRISANFAAEAVFRDVGRDTARAPRAMPAPERICPGAQ